jgi:hypothetical protein
MLTLHNMLASSDLHPLWAVMNQQRSISPGMYIYYEINLRDYIHSTTQILSFYV